MKTPALAGAIERALQGRSLVWFGTRGDDLDSLHDLHIPLESFTILSTGKREFSQSLSYEDLSGERVDLESWDIDDVPPSAATEEFWETLLLSISRPSALIPYRPSATLSLLLLSRQQHCLSLGMFANHQHAFEYKPWVETQVKELGVITLGWEYIAHHEHERVQRMLDDGPLILRRSRTSGGEGIHYLEDPSLLQQVWPHTHESFVSVSRYVEHAIPLNVGGVIWDDDITVHHPSVQIMGAPTLTNRRFGHCGNDFAFIKQLDSSLINTIEKQTARVGEWMKSAGYRGAFGVDFLLTQQGDLLFTEVNARFQGSTRATSHLSRSSGLPCIVLEHLAAFLRLPATARPPLADQVHSAPDLAQAIVHHCGDTPVMSDAAAVLREAATSTTPVTVDVLPSRDLWLAPSSTVARLTFEGGIASDGHHLDPAIRDVTARIHNRFTSTQRH